LYRDAAEKYGSSLERLASTYEADPEKRRDLSQDIHFQLWRSFQRYDARCSLRTWVYRVAHHVAASHVLRERRIFSKLLSLEEIEILPLMDRTQFAAGQIEVDQRRNLVRLSALIQLLKPLDRQVIVFISGGFGCGIDRRNYGAIARKRSHEDTSDQEHPLASVSRRRQPCRMITPATTQEQFGKTSQRSHPQ
jgi:RNA polymerase sigma-70 factor, ECF subfamily